MSRRTLFASALAALSIACGDASLEAISAAPPGTVAEYKQDLANDTRSVRLTRGIALALECKDDKGKPCSLEGTAVADPVATVHRGWVDGERTTTTRPTTGTSKSRTVLVVVGREVGHTTMKVVTGRGDVNVDVDVIAAP